MTLIANFSNFSVFTDRLTDQEVTKAVVKQIAQVKVPHNEAGRAMHFKLALCATST